MIFLTIGSSTPFDRLVRAVDEWAQDQPRDTVFAQIGRTSLVPQHVPWVDQLTSKEFKARVRSAQLIVSHAGMGTVLTALEVGTPLLVLPRRGDLQETRNDHQRATACWLATKPGITVAEDEHQVGPWIDRLRATASPERISPVASGGLIDALAAFIRQG